MTELKKCSRCRCQKLEKFFSKRKNTGQFLKICDPCRNRFKCHQCDYNCSKNSDLKRHIKSVHDKIKDIECPKEDCDYNCSKNSTLKRHIKMVHDKIKDFECHQCDYKTSENSNLQRHIKKCTGKNNYSAGEYQIMKTLDEMNIEYKYNCSYEVKNKNLLRWDFIIETESDPLFIEYNGKQHYEPQRFGGMSKEHAEVNFQKQKTHDKIKQDYCDKNGFPLLWISYKNYENINSLVVNFIRSNTDWGYE